VLDHVKYWRRNGRNGEERHAFYQRHTFDPKLVEEVEAEIKMNLANCYGSQLPCRICRHAYFGV